MVDLKLSLEGHDLDIEDNDLVLVDEADELRQHLRMKLWFFYGEWFLDTTKGVRFFEDVLVKNPNIGNIETLLKRAILGTEGVTKLLEFSLEYTAIGRSATVTFKVESEYGEVDVTDLNLGV